MKPHILLPVLIAFIFLMPAHAMAEAGRIAVLDLDKILSDSSAGQSIQKQLKTKREAFQKEFSSRENNLVNAEKTLIQEKASLTPEAFEAKRKDFEKQLSETRNLFQQRRNALDIALDKALEQLRQDVTRITEEIAAQENYSVVLTRENIVIIAKEMDITDKVLARMDQTTKTIPLVVNE